MLQMDDSVGGNGGKDSGSRGDKSNNSCTPKKPYDGSEYFYIDNIVLRTSRSPDTVRFTHWS